MEVVIFILFYVLGVILSYMSTVFYYYRQVPHTNKSIKLKVAKEKTTDDEFSVVALFLSWVYFIAFMIIVLTQTMKYLIDKILKLLLNA